MAGKIEVPRSISEAPTDRLHVSVKIDGLERIITGARAPTVGQSAGEGSTRSPSNYLLGARVQQNQQTTIQIVMRALVGTMVFDFLDQAARDEDNISLDFRTFGKIRDLFSDVSRFAIAAKSEANNGTKGLSEITGVDPDTSGPLQPAPFTAGDTQPEDGKPHLLQGGVLVPVAAGTDEGDDFILEDANLPSADLDFIVISDILYDAAGKNPKVYTKGRAAVAAWPSGTEKHLIAHCDQSVKWTAKGDAQSFQPGFGEDSSLYTLDVTLTEAMPRAEIIHPADVGQGNPAYA